MPAPHITPLPTPPSRSQSPDTFSTDADNFLGALPEFQADANTQADYLDGLADQVTLDAASANAAAAVATGAANYKGDYSAGATYQIGDSVSYNGRRYVAKTVNTGVTPADGANWFLINDGDVLGPASATNNELAVFDGTTGKFIKGGIGNGALGALLASGGSGNAPAYLSQGAAGQVLTSSGAGNNPAWADLPPAGAAVQAVAYGSLSDGAPVIINADGTVAIASGEQELNASAVFDNAGVGLRLMSAAYDVASGKVVIAYSDSGNSGYGTAVVGTVTGTTISFGTPIVFASVSVGNGLGITYHEAAQKIVVVYGTTTGIALVGTVSGTSITFGSSATFSSSVVQFPSVTYDKNSQKIVVAFGDGSPNIVGMAAVGTVSGTSISFGSKATFVASTSMQTTSCAYDESAQKVVIAYSYFSDGSWRGAVIAGTVSGTSISFGAQSSVDWSSTQSISAVYSNAAQKTFIFFRDAAAVGGKAVVCTVSGTSINLSSKITFTTNSADYISAAFNEAAQQFVVFYSDATNSNYATSVIGQFVNNNLTFSAPTIIESAAIYTFAAVNIINTFKIFYSYRTGGGNGLARVYGTSSVSGQNFIGFSDGSYSNGQIATIKIVSSVVDKLSGLAAGKSYYLLRTGALSLNAGTPSIFAGTAISPNKIIVKG